MAAIYETAYPRLKPNPSDDELNQNFLPSAEELALMKNSTRIKSLHSQIGGLGNLTDQEFKKQSQANIFYH